MKKKKNKKCLLKLWSAKKTSVPSLKRIQQKTAKQIHYEIQILMSANQVTCNSAKHVLVIQPSKSPMVHLFNPKTKFE